MTVIALINKKGGCSKSTTAVHLSYWLSRQGYKVKLLDADAQRSSSIWLNSMEDNSIAATVLQSPDELLEQIPELAQECDYLVVDGAAGLAESTRAILFRCDLAVVPCQPTGLDLQSASDAVRLIKQAQSVRGGAPKAAVFISRAVKGTKLKDEAIALLSKTKEITVLKTVVHQKQIIADTFGQAATVWDLTGRPATESAREYDKLFKEILGMVK
ncbi:AAA family ATPase [Brunnivagina elsteri]|uniref:Cobyrinic acid a,c-diamide synthase n=1 Tax=Brunnivagina elsteri CCALA 953 TaxID=987040 RepID=A0A2A2TJB7_9CYAN|nr:AAA family ATPase [Calothrix elsteri]PAX54883.1 cobyrinic acid a,c-diamide synthase [Calothrix elsteri CCALA 953]